MNVTVRCFASVRELLGTEVLEIDLPEGTTVERLRARLAEDAPEIARLPLAYAVNQDYAEPGRALRDGDEVAFIPPISGGSGRTEVCRFDLSHDPLDPRPLEVEARTDQDGAVVAFSGVTRDHNEGESVEHLEYECYEPMARKVMGQIFEEALARFEIGRLRVAHRLGEVPIGEASVVVVVSAAHRGPAFDACRFVMDRLKASVPIFKKEKLTGPDGRSRWVGDLPAGPA